MNSIIPLVCGNEDCMPNYTYGPNMREYYLLHYVISGKGVLIYPRGRFSVGAGQILVIRPYEMNTYTSDEKNPWYYQWIGFLCSASLDWLFTSDVIIAPECGRFFEEMFACSTMKDGREWYLCGKFMSCLTL